MSLEHADFLLPASKVSKFSSDAFSLWKSEPAPETPHFPLSPWELDCAHELFKHRFEARDVSSGARRDSLRRDVLETACGLQDVISSASASCCRCSFCCCCLFPCLLF